MRWKPRSRVARMARVARGSIDIETFGNWKKWLQDVASRDRWTKSDTATPRHQEQSRPKEVLKRQDQLGHGKRKHFDESEWKKKCSNFTKCGKPNEQLSRYNQTLLLAFILQTSEGLEVSFQRACRSQLRIGCYIAGMNTTLLFQCKPCSSGPTGHENLSNYSPGTADRPSLQVELASISKQRTAVVIGHKVFKPFPALTPQWAQFGAYFFRAIAGSGAPLRGCTANSSWYQKLIPQVAFNDV